MIAYAWAAGFFDGEGTVSSAVRRTRRGTAYRRIEATVAQAGSRELPERLRRVLGIGRVGGPYERAGAQPYFIWRVTSVDDVRRVYELIEPWLGTVKRRQFAEAFAAWDAFIPEPVTCPHGGVYATCSDCHRASAAKGWETRRAAA